MRSDCHAAGLVGRTVRRRSPGKSLVRFRQQSVHRFDALRRGDHWRHDGRLGRKPDLQVAIEDQCRLGSSLSVVMLSSQSAADEGLPSLSHSQARVEEEKHFH